MNVLVLVLQVAELVLTAAILWLTVRPGEGPGRPTPPPAPPTEGSGSDEKMMEGILNLMAYSIGEKEDDR